MDHQILNYGKNAQIVRLFNDDDWLSYIKTLEPDAIKRLLQLAGNQYDSSDPLVTTKLSLIPMYDSTKYELMYNDNVIKQTSPLSWNDVCDGVVNIISGDIVNDIIKYSYMKREKCVMYNYMKWRVIILKSLHTNKSKRSSINSTVNRSHRPDRSCISTIVITYNLLNKNLEQYYDPLTFTPINQKCPKLKTKNYTKIHDSRIIQPPSQELYQEDLQVFPENPPYYE